MPSAAAFAEGGGDVRLGLNKIHFAGDGFQNSISRATLLHSQIEKGRLILSWGLQGLLFVLPR